MYPIGKPLLSCSGIPSQDGYFRVGCSRNAPPWYRWGGSYGGRGVGPPILYLSVGNVMSLIEIKSPRNCFPLSLIVVEAKADLQTKASNGHSQGLSQCMSLNRFRLYGPPQQTNMAKKNNHSERACPMDYCSFKMIPFLSSTSIINMCAPIVIRGGGGACNPCNPPPPYCQAGSPLLGGNAMHAVRSFGCRQILEP